MYGMTPSYVDPVLQTILMITALIVQTIFEALRFVPINIWDMITGKEWIYVIQIIIVLPKICSIIDSYILVFSKTLSNKTCHFTFQVFGSIAAIMFFLFYSFVIIALIDLGPEIILELAGLFLIDLISLTYCNICSYNIIKEIKEYDLIPQMNFPYYPSNVRFFNPVMEMRELPPQTNFMPKMLFPFMGNVQVPN